MNRLREMEDFPERDSDVEQSYAGNRAAYPSGSNRYLKRVDARLARRIQKKVVVAPVAKTQSALRNPRQQRQHDADLKAKNYIKNDTQFG
jgi:hypothetical protein